MSATSTPPPTSTLDRRTVQLLNAFTAMDDERQLEMIGFLEDVAKAFPRAPRLRLIVSNEAAGA